MRSNIINEKFGLVTVLECISDKTLLDGNHSRNYKCKCDCGNIFEASDVSILISRTNGETKSCGCKRRFKRIALQVGTAKDKSYRGLLNNYKQRAKKRKYCWELKHEEALRMFNSNCFYCGLPPSKKFNVYITNNGSKTAQYKRGGKYRADDAWILYTGIDRLVVLGTPYQTQFHAVQTAIMLS